MHCDTMWAHYDKLQVIVQTGAYIAYLLTAAWYASTWCPGWLHMHAHSTIEPLAQTYVL